MSQNNPTPWGAIATGVTGVLGMLGQKKRANRQLQQNKSLAKYQFDMQADYQDKTWEKTMQYNDPKAQMARYQNAGINPHMAYMSGGGSNTTTSPGTPSANVESPEVAPNTGSMLGGILEKYLQNKAMENQIRSDKAKADQEEIRAQLMAEGLDYKKGNEKRKAKADFEYNFGSNNDAPKYNDGQKLTRYEERLQKGDDLQSLQALISKSQEALNKITAQNLITNDQLVDIQTQVAQAQFDFLQSDWFKELPSGIKAIFMMLSKKMGGI